MPAWCVYILRCADGSLYAGLTNNLPLRLVRHRSGKGAKYTRSRLPVELVWKKRMPSATAARKEEAVIKKMTRAQKNLRIEGKKRKRDMV